MKKILWLVNIPLPEVDKLMGKKSVPFGGWLVNLSQNLARVEGIKLYIAFPHNSVKKIEKYKGKYIEYYAFKPIKKTDKKNDFKEMLKEIKPDIVHIHGTEFEHSLEMVKACKEERIKEVISIQGLVSVCAKHMNANLPLKVIYGITLRNLLLRDNINGVINQFKKRGKSEIEAIKNTSNIIGRTNWDLACTKQINSNINYFSCNENLRKEFYEHNWNIEKIEKYSIFLSQGQYSIKGLHYVIEALPLILKKYPDTKLYVGGKNIISTKSLKDRLLMTYYGKYIKNIIKKYKLENKVEFLGLLDEQEMCARYLKSHVFVCPSTIENSPNSLGEAMLLGVPSIATNVGGIQDMLTHKKEGFIYQTDAPYMLAYYICKVFEDDNLACELSKNSKERALETHNSIKNLKKLLEIYNKIGGEN